MYPVEEAILDIIPKKTTMADISDLGVPPTIRLNNTDSIPEPSATLTPMITVKTVPSGKKPVKLLTTLVTI